MSQVMDFIKAHTLALACAVVALLAMIAFFVYPIPGMFGELQTEVAQSEQTYTSLTSLRDATRTVPAVELEGEAKPLTVYPTPPVIKEGQEALRRLSEQAQATLEQAIRINQRPLLVPGSLPSPTSLARQQFYDAYRVVTAQTGEQAERGIIRNVLRGALPPSEAELKAIGDARANEIYSTQLQTDAERRPVNQPEVDAAITRMRAELPMQLRIDRAMNSTMYVSPNAVEVHPAMQVQTLPEAPTIFNAQYSLWLQTLAFEALADANKGAKNVLDAPVKHLVSLRVPMEVAPITGTANTAGFGFGGGEEGMAAAPAELTPDPAGAITPDYSAEGGPFGYSHNSLYDPVQIQMTLRVDVRQLPNILATLGRERLLKVRNVNFRTVDAGRALQEGYVYDQTGKTPLVEVTIECDVLMLRPWIVPLMPPPVKAYFATLSNPAAAAPM